MDRSFASPVCVGMILLITLLLLGCQAVSRPAPLPPTVAPTVSPNVSPTPCLGLYRWAYGSVPPEFLPRVQEAMIASGLEGSVQASTFGEDNGCGEYLVRNVDYHFTVQVQDLEANEDLANQASSILEIARSFVEESSAPELGNLQLTFLDGDQHCDWSYQTGAWIFQSGNVGKETACQAPTTPESQRMADALTALAVDLGCETSTVRADTLHAELECERSEGEELYHVNVSFSLGDLSYADTCFHGWGASEYNLTGEEPMQVSQDGNTFYGWDRSFQWSANGTLFYILERIKGGPDVTLPPDTRETVYRNALRAELISGEGNDCQ